ncbi:MAG: cupin domain-containing protein [Acidobacteria bacterium]|nr:cupin domain-containing protein [Acidobacteriota bacterium]
MRRFFVTSGLALAMLSSGIAEERKEVVVQPANASLRWESDGCAGESLAVVSGCPFQQGAPFVLRLRMEKGLFVPSHSHPIDENITVLRGRLTLRILKENSPITVVLLRQGDFFRIPAYAFHLAEAVEETEIQTNGIGPLVTTWMKDHCKPAVAAAPRSVDCKP